jgi:transketolase
MEGVASEAASLAGHLKIGKIIYLYDDNKITIDGSTDLAFTEDREKRFQAYGWHTIRVNDGNNVDEIDKAIQQAKKDPRPSLILCREPSLVLDFPRGKVLLKHTENHPHGRIECSKNQCRWPLEPMFYVPDEVCYISEKLENEAQHFIMNGIKNSQSTKRISSRVSRIITSV